MQREKKKHFFLVITIIYFFESLSNSDVTNRKVQPADNAERVGELGEVDLTSNFLC
jgi:hypothetical protein